MWNRARWVCVVVAALMSAGVARGAAKSIFDDDWVPPKPGQFVEESMNALADLGEKLGADPNVWMTEPPMQ